MTKARILLVEGRGAGIDSLAAALRKVGFVVDVAYTGKSALSILETEFPNLIVFDASSMRSTGTRTCKRLRQQADSLPIIHCRAVNEALDTQAEADAYLMHPFTSRKLLNRVRALLPADPQQEEIIRLGHITFYRNKRSVEINGQGEKRLTPKLADLLEAFMRHPNLVLNRKWLMETVWKTSYMGDTRTLDVHIRWIRERIEQDPCHPRNLITVRGVGYILSVNKPEPEA